MSDIKLPDGFERVELPEIYKKMPEGFQPAKIPSFDLSSFQDPEQEAARLQNSAFIHDHLNVDTVEAHGDVDEYIRQMTGEETPPHKKFSQELRETWNYGQQTVELGKTRWRQMFTMEDEETNLAIENLKSQMIPPEKAERSWPAKALLAAAETVPIMLAGAKRGMKTGLAAGTGGAIVAAIAGQAGPQVLFPEEAITVPGAFLLLFRVGMAYGSAMEMVEIEGGLAFDSMWEMGVDPSIAKPIAIGVGVINGLIETAQMDELLKTFPGGKTLFRNAVAKATRKVLAEGGLKNIALGFAKKYGKHITIEVTQEIIQEVVAILGEEIAIEWQNRTPGYAEAGGRGRAEPVQHATSGEILNRLKDTAIQSALAFAVLAFPGTTTTSLSEVVQSRQEKARAEAKEGVGVTEEQKTPEQEAAIVRALATDIDLKYTKALKTKDGKIHTDPNANYHVEIADLQRIDPMDVAGSGRIVDGIYMREDEFLDWVARGEKAEDLPSEEDQLLRTMAEAITVRTDYETDKQTPIVGKLIEPTAEIKQEMRKTQIVEIEGGKYTRKELRKAQNEARELKLSELVEELQQLKTGTGKRALGKAFTAGKETGLSEQKGLVHERKLQALARKEQRERLNKIIGDLQKVRKKLDVMSEAQSAPIRELIDGLDFTKHRTSTLISLEKTRQYFENNPEVEISDGLKERLEMLDKKSIRDLSMDEVEDIYTAIMHHAHLEKRKQQIRIGLQEHKAALIIAQTMNEMKPPKQIAPEIVSSKIAPAEKAKAVGRKIKNFFGLRHNHYDLIIEQLAGTNSTMDKVLFQQVKEGIVQQLRYRQEAFKTFQKHLEATGFRRTDVDRWLNERVQVGKFNLTRNERMELYNHFLNEDNRDSMLAQGIGFKYGPDRNQAYQISYNELMAIVNSLTPEERAFAGQPVRNLFENQYEKLNTVFKEKNGYELPKEEIYFPKDVMPISRGMDIEKETALEQFRGQWTRVGLKKGMLERRQRVSKPIYIHGLTRTINESVMNSAAYIGLELPLSDASKLLYNKNFREQMVLRYGKETWSEIEKGLRDIAGEWRSYTDFEEALTSLRAKMSTAMLGLNPFVMIKQPLSYAAYSTYVKPKYLLQGIVDYMTDGKELVERHKLYSPEYLERLEGGFSRDVQEVTRKAGAEKRLYKGRSKLPEKLMAGIKWFDKHTVTPGMQGAVLQVLSEFQDGKLSEEVKTALNMRDQDISELTVEEKTQKAYKFADWVTNRTQPTFAPEHRSSLSRGTPVEKLFTQFSSFTNQALNLLRRTLNEARRTKSKTAIQRATRAFVAIMLVNAIGNAMIDELRDLLYRRNRDDDWTWKVIFWATKSVTGLFYGIRDLADSVLSKIRRGTFAGYDVSIPVTRAATLFTDVVAHGIRMLSHPSKRQKRKEMWQFFDTSSELTLMLNGLPYSTPKNIGKRVIEEIK